MECANPEQPDATPARSDLRILVVVPNYGTPGLTLGCLRALRDQLQAGRDEAVVVDDASPDDSVARIAAQLEEPGWEAVRLLRAQSNAGFGATLNLGIASAPARAYLVLNSDTIVRSGALGALWETLEQDPGVGIASPRLEWPDGRPQISCFRLPTPWSELINSAATGPITALLQRWDVPLPVRDEPFEPPWTSFAAALLRRELLDSVGPIDEKFFMYFEDVEYCRRARAAGWAIHHQPRARVVHLRGGTSPVKAFERSRRRRPRYFYSARRRYFRLAYGPVGPLAANAMWTLGRSISKLRELLRHKQPHTVERELLDCWRG